MCYKQLMSDICLELGKEPDGSRREEESRHDTQELLLVTICAVLGWAGVALCDWAKLPWLRQFLSFENGVASHETFERVFRLLDAAVHSSMIGSSP